ncbi:MAG: RNA 2',3'-cyclic phosphodiesterase [Candidatus Dojkabacteria bacterium]
MDTSHHRVFLAFRFPKNVRDFLRDNIRHLSKRDRKLRFVNIDQLHLTLQFLGDNVSTESLVAVSEVLKRLASTLASPEIKITNSSFGFPGQTVPRVVFWDVEHTKSLVDFTKTVHDSVRDLDLPDVKRQKDHSKLIHHITIARVKNSISRGEARRLRTIIGDFNQALPEPFKPKSLDIIESSLTKKGSSYKLYESFPLNSRI